MGCLSCAKRGRLIGAGVRAIIGGKPTNVRPIVKAIGQTVVNDFRAVLRPSNPRLGPKR